MSHDTTATVHDSAAAHAAIAEHGAHGAKENPRGAEVFTHLIDDLGDHHEFNFAFQHLDILPVILVDNGLHVYSNKADMEQAGIYTMNAKGHPVLKADTHHHPALDLSVTNYVAYEWMAIILVSVLLIISGRRYKKNPLAAPRGVQNLMESIVLYVRDQIARPNLGTDKRTTRLMPYLLGLFFFILALNLISLLPGAHAATGAVGVTAALALTSFAVVNYTAMRDAGVGAWFHHLLGGAPAFLAPIMVPIEIVSLFIKPIALTIRLFANMTAGHIVLLSLVGLIFYFETVLVAPVSVAFSVFIYLLELLVAFLQAYIFTMLTSVFIGLALGDHVKDDHHGHAHH
jgi:F-type H+-transporting ATPase subunit a